MIDNRLATLSYCQSISGFNYTNPIGGKDDDTAIVSNLIQAASNFFEKYTNRKLKARSYSGNGNVAQVSVITCLADVSGSLSGVYFLINTVSQSFYVWFNVTGLLIPSVDPAISGVIGIQVDIAENSTNVQVAGAIINALNVNGSWVAGAVNNIITATNLVVGSCINASAGTSGFTVSTSIEGEEVDPSCTFDTLSRRAIYLPNYPINSISALYIDMTRQFGSDTLLDSSRYTFYPETGEIYLYQDIFPIGKKIVRCFYNGGYDPIPDDLQLACATLVEFWYKLLTEHRVGVQGSGMQQSNIRYDEKSVPQSILDVLDKYVRIIL